MAERKIFTLSQIGVAIDRQISAAAGDALYWIRAEIANIRIARHAYLELCEHRQGAKVAVLRGVIWGSTLTAIQEALGAEAANILKHGVEILFCARVEFHLVHGLSLVIEEIDPSFNIGALEQRKKRTIEQLKAEGLYDRNRFVPMPMIIQRVALITSPGSAAHSDFMKHLEENEHNYRFHVHLFAAAVQGEGATEELRAAFARVDVRHFDAIAIIRGGGSKLDLEPFNDLELVRLAAQCPIPILTGIGHDVDISVLDLIARSPHKTPTAVADHLVDRFVNYESRMNNYLVGIQNAMMRTFAQQKERLSAILQITKARPLARCQEVRGSLRSTTTSLAGQVKENLRAAQRQLDEHASGLRMIPARRLARVEAEGVQVLAGRLRLIVDQRMVSWMARLNGLKESMDLLSPERTLGRGYSITRSQGKAITDAGRLQVGDELETTFAHGRSLSIIKHIEPHER